MSTRFGGLSEKPFIVLLVLLVAIGLSLFTVLNFVATSQLTEVMGLTSFIVVTVLLIVGYMLGFVVLAFLGIHVLTKFWQRAKK